MVLETQTIETRDKYYRDQIAMFTAWEDRVGYVCSMAKNYEAAITYGRKVQRCNNNAFIHRHGNMFITYSDSQMVSGLMALFSFVYGFAPMEVVQTYQPKFIELLVDVIPDQTILNLIESFRKA